MTQLLNNAFSVPDGLSGDVAWVFVARCLQLRTSKKWVPVGVAMCVQELR